MIPKIIHYCWFGGNELPELAIKCLNSWKKHCKGYKIIEWNENNFDISKAPLYVRQAYEAKKWAFVSDYVRLWALVNHGGVYMDTDVQVVKPLDKFLVCNAFSGFEDDIHISTGIMGCEKDFPLFVEFLDYYNDALFLNSDGSFNTVTNVIIMTKICSGIGLEQNNKFQVIDGFALYPKDYFCPIDYSTGLLNKTNNTVTIHWFSGSWLDESQKKEEEKRREEAKRQYLLAKREKRRNYMVHFPNIILNKALGDNRYERLKKIIKKK